MIYTVIQVTNPSQLFLVHLNAYDIELLQQEYKNLFPESKVIVPKYNEEYTYFLIK